ncbi:ead/Ea22-like family protein [Serratia marcescens]|uniref:ead/Ea22-like family protein n=1 Tax=Serratia marcescens TaxID=615 RepID=UPI003CFD0DBA
MDKFSELKAAAMAATPGPWILDDDSWSEGDNANVSTEERYDGRIVSIAQIEGGGSESGFDEPFSTEQQANARYITAANPAAVLALLAELEAKDKRIAELEAKTAMTMGVGSGNGNLFVHGDYDSIKAAQAIVLENESLRAKLATPVRLTDERTLWAGEDDYDTGHVKGWNANRIEQAALLKKQGFTAEGDE